MRLPLARLLLPLVLAFAFVVRWEPTRVIELAPDEQRDLAGARWLLDDPDTCHELRRVELALAGDRVPTHDRFVDFPADGEIPSLPLFDGFVAGIAQRFLSAARGDAALGGVVECDLEDFVVKLGPILGLLAVLSTWWAARSLASGTRGDLAPLLAAAFVAFHPVLIAPSMAGRLDSSALMAILLALLLRSGARSIRSDAMPASLLDALIAGVLSGFLLSGSVVGVVVFLAFWLGYFVRAWRSSGESRSNALRAGVFFTIVAVFVTRMALGERHDGGTDLVGAFSEGLSLAVFFSVGPWLGLMLLDRSRPPSAFRMACFVTALALLAWQAPKAWDLLAPAVIWYLSERELVAVVLPGNAPLSFGAGSVVLHLSALIVLVHAWRRRGEDVPCLLGITTLALLGATWITALAAPLCAVVVACGLAHALDDASSSRGVFRVAGLAAVGLLGLALYPVLSKPDPARREARLDFVAGLRWLRTHTEASGPWNSPRTPSAWGVLSDTAAGPLVLYHARRPALASPWGVLSGPRALVETSERLHGPKDLAALERLMQGQRARYVVVGADPAHGERERPSLLERGSQPSPADQLLAAAATVPPGSATGFVLEHVSTRRIDARGATQLAPGAGLPVVAIWRLERFDAEPPRAELRAR